MMKLLALLALVWVPRVLACSCEAPDFPDAVKAASAIYRGQAVKSEPAGEGLRQVTFKVERTWKGAASPTITATHQPSVCEAGFVVGSEYLVLESGSKAITVDICSNTKLIVEATRELAYLEKKFPAAKTPVGKKKK
jgi:hypothetical protein